MSRLPLTLAISHYDHVTDLVTGRVPVEGIELTCLNLQIEIFPRSIIATSTRRKFPGQYVSLSRKAMRRWSLSGVPLTRAAAFVDLCAPRRAEAV